MKEKQAEQEAAEAKAAEQETAEAAEAEKAEDAKNAEEAAEPEVDPKDAKIEELQNRLLRLQADFENFRRRTAREKIDLIANANAELMKAVLPIVDDFERAMLSFESTTELEPLKEGVELVAHKFFKTLEGKGLKPMASKGEVFDAELHESVTQFPAPSEDLKGKVIDEIEKGYYLNDKVLRYAKVVVGA